MKIRIECDGTAEGTTIVDTETGKHLEQHCTSLEVKVAPSDVQATLTLVFFNKDVELSGDFGASQNKKTILREVPDASQ